MPDLVLNEREQKALRALYARDPVPGALVPPADVLEVIAELVACDAMGVALCSNSGPLLAEIELPVGFYDRLVDHEALPAHPGPLFVGRVHWSRSLHLAEQCGALPDGIVDGVAVGYRNGPDAVAQIWFDRERTKFSERDLAILDLLWPVLQRHLRQQPTRRLPSSVTVQERRVLMEVASGFSNSEIAEALGIAPSTVRKHLEHAYRKLGVSNRVAAVVALHGGPLHDAEETRAVEEAG